MPLKKLKFKNPWVEMGVTAVATALVLLAIVYLISYVFNLAGLYNPVYAIGLIIAGIIIAFAFRR